MATMPYDAVLFDLDGTLTRSEEGILNCVRFALEKMGRDIPEDQVLRAFIGPPLHTSFSEITGMNAQECDRAVELYRQRFSTVGLYENAVYTGIRTLLRMLKSAGVWLGVATSKPQIYTERILEYFGLRKFFSAVSGTGANEMDSSKTGLIKRALPERWQHAVMVGDRRFDVEGAKGAGIAAIGAAYGYGSVEELQTAGADRIAASVQELTALLCPGEAPPRGFFLTVEGLDGSGKTTQADLLEKCLVKWGCDVRRTREPGGCPISEKIRQVVLDIANVGMSPACEALLYAASRAEHVREVIRPSVEKGMVVLCDRFVDSSIVYQGAGRQLGVDLVASINAPAVDDMVPDCTVYLDIDHLEALRRRGKASQLDRIEIEGAAFHERVALAYRQLAKDNADRYVTVDGSRSPEEIGEEAFEAVRRRLEAMEGEQ